MAASLNCEDVIEKLMEYLDRELDEQLQQEIDEHLEICRGCFSRAEFERRLKARIAEAGKVTAPERLRQRVAKLTHKF